MNKKLQKLMEPGTRLFFVFLIVFAVIAFLRGDYSLAAAEGAIIVILAVYSLIAARKRRRELVEYIESLTYDTETAKNDTILNFPLPMVVFRLDDLRLVWGNPMFFDMIGRRPTISDIKMTEIVPDFSGKWLYEGKSQYPSLVTVGDRKYQIHGNVVRGGEENEAHDFMGITYWLDVTDLDNIKQEYESSRPVVAILVLDNYEEMIKKLPERAQNALLDMVNDRVEQWTEGRGGILRRLDRDRYLYIFEERWYAGYAEKKFSLIDSVHEVVSTSGIHATVSIGIGRDGASFEENLSFALLSADMALSRGGDQAVVKNRFHFEFFGGRGSEVETRTKVKSRVTANALSALIGDASKILIMGHRFADLDAIGAAAGLCCIARNRGKRAYIVIDPEENAAKPLINRIKQRSEYAGVFLSPQQAMLDADSKTLLIVVDTSRPEQVEDESLLMACNKVAVIDHHRRAVTCIENPSLLFYEPYASSTCELITELISELVNPSDILLCEAEAMLAGIMLDTKNFTLRTGDRTFDAAAFLRRAGADTTEVKKLLQNDLSATVARYTILQRAKLYKSCIAIAVMEASQDRVVAAQAADELLNVRGVSASIVAYPTEDGGMVISARSIGDINVQVLMEKLGGGGNKSTAGAQLKDTDIKAGTAQVLAAIDEYFEEEET